MNQEGIQKSRARSMAVVMGSAVLISLIVLVFAIIQKSEADMQTEIAQQNFRLVESERVIAEHLRIELEKAKFDLPACKGK